jgi:hypothetical protein
MFGGYNSRNPSILQCYTPAYIYEYNHLIYILTFSHARVGSNSLLIR